MLRPPALFWMSSCCRPAVDPCQLQVGEEVAVLVAEGLRPADLVQELLELR